MRVVVGHGSRKKNRAYEEPRRLCTSVNGSPYHTVRRQGIGGKKGVLPESRRGHPNLRWITLNRRGMAPT